MSKNRVPPGSKDLALQCAKAAIDKKANNSLIYEVGRLDAFTDYFLITSGSNERQVQAIADEIRDTAKKAGVQTVKLEGYEDGRWVLVDLGDVIVHVFQDYIREFYDLESFWAEAPRLPIPPEYYMRAASPSEARAATSSQR